MRRPGPVLLVLCGVLALDACRTTPGPVSPAVAPVAAPAAADDTFNATVWFQTAIERELVFREVYRAAGERLDTALADPTFIWLRLKV